ncbi:uncharacterized protein LOC131253540 isoform X3 [Magnolia sinica]|uniref:uncharacterized protein LOC131253540 isoform X3 n=1 Tax=Magnolia sinica TaxID=86752 RepID=UPI002659B363|nr:uncharacterized protein LOC131253540 isoform X3 [Magnolia sinica]
MDLRTKALKRKPLSDLTNTSPLLPISSSIGPKPNPKPKTRSSSGPKSSSRPVGSLSSSDTSIGSSNALEQLQQCPTNPEPDSSRASENVEWEDFEQLKIYNRRSIQGKNKGKAVAAAVPSSCPPARRIRSLGNRLKSHDDVDLSKTLSVPRPKSKKKRRHSMPEDPAVHVLSQDFIDKQRAYFAEIDAFELQEEEVSESEME